MEDLIAQSFSELAYSQLYSIFIKRIDGMKLIVDQSSIIEFSCEANDYRPTRHKYYMTVKWFSYKCHMTAEANSVQVARNECAFKIMCRLVERNIIPVLV